MARRPPPPATDSLGFALAKASQRWNELLHDAFTQRGFPEVRPAYGSLLLPLFEQDGLRMSELAERARLSKQTLTTMVPLLERAGLVRRERDPTDGRAQLVYLTPKAREVEAAAAEILAGLERRVARRLGAEDRATLRRALQEIMAL